MTPGSMHLALLLQTVPDLKQGKLFANFTIPNLSMVAVLLAIAWVAIRLLGRLFAALSERAPRSRFAILWMEQVVRIAIWFTAFFISFRILSSNEAFIAALASLGIALGLGMQDLVKNVVGGLVVLADRPYQTGDRVRFGNAYGEIIRIGLRSTKLVTPDDTMVTVPNAEAMTTQVFNSNSGVPDCQVVTDIVLPPDTDPDTALRVGYGAAHCSPYLLLSKPVVVLVSTVFSNRPYLQLRVKSYVFDHRYEPRMMSDITARAVREFRRMGIIAAWGSEAAPS